TSRQQAGGSDPPETGWEGTVEVVMAAGGGRGGGDSAGAAGEGGMGCSSGGHPRRWLPTSGRRSYFHRSETDGHPASRLFRVNLIDPSAVGEVDPGGLLPAAEDVIDREEVHLGILVGIL